MAWPGRSIGNRTAKRRRVLRLYSSSRSSPLYRKIKCSQTGWPQSAGTMKTRIPRLSRQHGARLRRARRGYGPGTPREEASDDHPPPPAANGTARSGQSRSTRPTMMGQVREARAATRAAPPGFEEADDGSAEDYRAEDAPAPVVEAPAPVSRRRHRDFRPDPPEAERGRDFPTAAMVAIGDQGMVIRNLRESSAHSPIARPWTEHERVSSVRMAYPSTTHRPPRSPMRKSRP